MMGGGKHGGAPMASKPTKLSALRITTSALGQVVPIIWGTQRIAPRMIWQGDFVAIPHTSTQSNGGKGGGGGGTTTTTTYSYQDAVDLLLCEADVAGILGIRNIWDTKGGSFYARRTQNFTVPGGGGSIAVNVPGGQLIADDLGVTRQDAYSVPVNDFGSDGLITLAGNQKTPMALVVGAPGIGQYQRAGNLYTFAAADAGKVMAISYTTIAQNTSGLTQSLGIYNLTAFLGVRPQSPWSYMVSRHAAQALGYNGIARVVSPAFDLGFSNNMVNLNFEVAGNKVYGSGIEDAEPSAWLTDVVNNIYYGLRGVIALGDLTSYRNWSIANGLFISPFLDAQRAASDFIQEMLDITNSAAFWSENQLKVKPYATTSVVGNGATFIAANTPIYDFTEDDFLSEVLIELADPVDAKNKFTVEYLNRLNDYNPDPAEAKDDAMIAQFGLQEAGVLTHHAITTKDVAKKRANWALRRSCDIRLKYTFPVGAQYDLCEPMDLVTLTDKTRGLLKTPVRLTGIKEDDKGKLNMTAENFPWGVADSTLYPHQDVTNDTPQDKADPGSVGSAVMFEPPFRLCSQPLGNELWIGIASINKNWGGASVWFSPDGSTYKKVGVINAPARLGVLGLGGLATMLDPDTTNLCPVDLTSSLAALVSGQQGDADNYRTMCYIAGLNPEFISYQTAAFVSANVYNLSYLRRGLGGTLPAAHLAGDPFLRLDESVFIWQYDAAIIGHKGFLKFTSFNTLGNMEQSIASATAYPFTFKGTKAVSGSEAFDELILTGTSPGGASASYRQFYTTPTYAIVASDELHYDLYFDPTCPEFKGGIDFEYGGGHTRFTAGVINDQNALSNDPSTDLAAKATGQWYHRKFAIGGLAGNTINSFAAFLEGDTAGLYKMAVANIRILNAGVLKANIFGIGQNAVQSVPVWAFGSENYTGVRAYSVHNYPKGFDPATDQIGSTGSIPPSYAGTLGYSSTTTTVTIWWDGTHSSVKIVIFRDDGSAVPIPDGTLPITGLTVNTGYFTYPFGAESDLSLISFANTKATSTPVGTPAMCYTAKDRAAAAQQNAKGNVCLSNGAFAVATTAAGTGGGSGGGDGTCIRSTMWVIERTLGKIRLAQVKVGDWLLTRNDQWTEVTRHQMLPQDAFLRFTTKSGKVIEATPQHGFTLVDGETDAEVDRRAYRIGLYDMFYIRTGVDRIVEAKEVLYPDSGFKVSISCSPDPTFFAGEADADVLTHNAPMLT